MDANNGPHAHGVDSLRRDQRGRPKEHPSQSIPPGGGTSAVFEANDPPQRPRRSSFDRVYAQSQSAHSLPASASLTNMLYSPAGAAQVPSARLLKPESSPTRAGSSDVNSPATRASLMPHLDSAPHRPRSLFEQYSDPALRTPTAALSSSPDRSMSPFYSKFSRSRSRTPFVTDQPRSSDEVGVKAGVMVWCSNQKAPSSSALSRTPMFRESSLTKHKLSKQGSSRPQDEIGPDTNYERASGFRGSAPSWLRERPSKSRLNQPSASANLFGQWKKATATLRDDGTFVLLGEDRALLHSLDCSSLSTSDVRLVHDSLFGRPHVLGIYPKTAANDSIVPAKKVDAERGLRSEQIFVEFAADVQLQYWLTLFKIYAQPELFGAADSAIPVASHRMYRQIDLTIHEAKTIMPRWPSELLEAPKSPLLPNLPHITGGTDRVLSTPQKLTSRKQDDFDDSPGSESCSSRGGSRSGSMSGSRSGSRVRQHTKTSLSNFQAQDADDGSGSSRAGSHITPDAETRSLAGDETSSLEERAPALLYATGEASRYLNEDYSHPSSLPTAPTKRRDERDLFESTLFDRYCRIRLDGELVARTSLRPSTNADAFKAEKFSLRDLPATNLLVIEVLHPTQKTTTNIAGMSANSSSKYMLLGVVEIPMDSLRRNEEMEGRFPIWSVSTFPANAWQTDDDGKLPTSFHRGVVGELKLTLKAREETVMLLSQYEQVQQSIHAADATQLIQGLASTLREDLIISHLTRIYAASGTITDSISALIESESHDWGDKLQPELLFRANTLLSRSVDHFQRLLAPVWLDDCLGATVRKICNEPEVERSDTPSSDLNFESGKRTPPVSPPNMMQTVPDGPIHAQTLRTLSEILWQNIYSQRHRCPADLRMVLNKIRTKVNDRFKLSKSTRPGIQGVGAFIFLRLFCAALNAPQLYGLTTSQPSRVAQRKLLLLSKVLLAMASKRVAFDQDKDWELAPLNDFLRNYSSAYDDYITVVSTEPPKATKVDMLGFRYDDDQALHEAVLQRLPTLQPLHRESVPNAPYMLDQPLALASFVSYVVTAIEESVSARTIWSNGGSRVEDHDCARDIHDCDQSEAHELLRKRSMVRKQVDEFVAICSKVEEMAGFHVQQAGYEPKPIAVAQLRDETDTGAGLTNDAGQRGDPTPWVESSPRPTSASVTDSQGVISNEDRHESGTSSPNRSRRTTINSGFVRPDSSSPTKAASTPTKISDAAEGPHGSNRKSAPYSLLGRRGSEVNVRGSPSSRGEHSPTSERISRSQRRTEDGVLREAYRALKITDPQSSRAETSIPGVARERSEAIRQTPRERAGSTASTVLPMDSDDAWSSQRTDVLLEADDGSTFEHVSSTPRPVVPRGLVRAEPDQDTPVTDSVARSERVPVSYSAARETGPSERPNGNRRHSSGFTMAVSASAPYPLSVPRNREPDALNPIAYAARPGRSQLSQSSSRSDLANPPSYLPSAGTGEKKKRWWKP